jgi:pimeloyl-ACP methyl ester carboxylesterase
VRATNHTDGWAEFFEIILSEVVMHTRFELEGLSYACLTDPSSANVAVIFVHGFWGCPEKTWIQFQTLMDAAQQGMPWWVHHDAFFYSYASEKQIGPNVASLLDFIRNVYPVPKWRELGTEDELAPRTYKSLILVGHSEGGVLIRGAILRRAQELEGRGVEHKDIEVDTILRANLRLFAPAVWGALLSGYTALLLRTPVLGRLVESRLQRSAAYKQLASDSPLLNDIRSRTVNKAKEYTTAKAFRARNLFPLDDEIVTAEALETDLPAEFEERQTHSSICKPTPRYLKPLTFVKDEDYALAATG